MKQIELRKYEEDISMATVCDSQKPDELLDFWYYDIGANIISTVSRLKTAKKDFQWDRWQNQPVPEELFIKWKNTGAFNDGVGIILGKLWRGSYAGMYLIGVDLDNQIAIEEFCKRNGANAISIEELAQWTIVEQHKDDPNRAHVYFLSDRPYAKKSSNAVNKKLFDLHTMPAIEVKGKGEHGILFCSPSIHKDGYRYEIIGTKVPAIVQDDYELHIDNICRKYGLTYLDDNTFESKVSLLIDPNHRNKTGERHSNTLTVINHHIYKNAYKLPEEQRTEQQIEEIILKYNREQNEPPLADQEVNRMFDDALKRSTIRLKAEESTIKAHHRRMRQQRTGKQQSEESEKQKSEKQTLVEDASETIIKTSRFLTVEESKDILYYNGNGVYVSGAEVLIEKEAERLLGYELSNKNLSEIKGHIMRRTYNKRSKIDADINIINLKNGLYNIQAGELKPHSPDYLSVNQKPIIYDPKAVPKLFGKYLHDVLYSTEIRTAVECMAYTFYRDNAFELITLLFGYGSNGKSVFTDTVTALHGTRNISNVPLSAIVNNPFALSDLEAKDVNIDSELSNNTIRDTAILKKLTGKQPIRIERKNQRAYDAKLHAKLFFSANKIPQTLDDSDAYYRRHIVICFPRKFEGNDADPYLSKKLTMEEELSGLFNVLMIALRRILRHKRVFVNEKTMQERREKYEMSTDPIGSFIKETVAEDSVAADQTTKEYFYQSLDNYCKIHNLAVPSKENVGKILKRRYGYQEGREASGDRKTVWKGVKLVDKYREKDSLSIAAAPAQFN